MGRNKIDIEYITQDRKRVVTLNKRKTGLIKKAYELSVLCGCEVALVVIDERGQSYLFGSHDANATLRRQLASKDEPCELVDNDAVRRKVESGSYDCDSGGEEATPVKLKSGRASRAPKIIKTEGGSRAGKSPLKVPASNSKRVGVAKKKYLRRKGGKAKASTPTTSTSTSTPHTLNPTSHATSYPTSTFQPARSSSRPIRQASIRSLDTIKALQAAEHEAIMDDTTDDDDDDDDEETEDDDEEHERDNRVKEEEQESDQEDHEQDEDVMDTESTDNESVVPDISNTSVARRISDVARRTLNRINKDVDQTIPWATPIDIASKAPSCLKRSNVSQSFSLLPSSSTLPTLPATSHAQKKKLVKKSRPNLKVVTRESNVNIKTEPPSGVYFRPTLTADQLGESWLVSPLKLPEVPDNCSSGGMSPFADSVKRRISLPSDSLRPILHSPTLGLISDVATPMSSMLSGSLWGQ